jgi:RecA-family ATPase
MFAGNEINRTEVTQFVGLCAGLAKRIKGSVLILGHIGKGESAREYSGSTAWNAAVRSRWLLGLPEGADDDDANENLRVLTKKKANYSSSGDSIVLEWERGAFQLHGCQGDNFVDRRERRNRAKEAERVFLEGLDELTAAQRATSHSGNATSYAPKLIMKTARAKGFRKVEIERAMERLFADGKIRADMKLWQRPNRHWQVGIKRVDKDEQKNN